MQGIYIRQIIFANKLSLIGLTKMGGGGVGLGWGDLSNIETNPGQKDAPF